MPEVTDNNLKAEVKAYWNRASCDTWHTQSEKYTREYFEQIEDWRYRDQACIHAFAQFTRYHGKRVVEVGFGAGTDFIQWLRAGAVASGVDLTEEALRNLTHRIEIYGLPSPEVIKVADAEKLPFDSDRFDLGYSWGVLHHTPDTEKSIRELVRVIRPGGEMKIMLYNRNSLCSFHHWVKYGLLKGNPFRTFRDVLWHHMESVGTKSYTPAELRHMLAPMGLTDIEIQTFPTSYDYLPWKKFPFSIANAFCGLLLGVTGNRLGFWHGITARKKV